MRKVLLCLLIAVIGFNSVGAYGEEEFLEEKMKYKKVLIEKFSEKISKIKYEKKIRLVSIINKKIEKYQENSSLSENEKLKFVSVFSAFADIVEDSLKEILIITVIDDKRCIDCSTKTVIDQLRNVDYLDGALIKVKDFKDDGVEEFVKENNIKYLPAVIFNKTDVSPEVDGFLVKLSPFNYNLDVGSTYDPFIKRSDKGFQILSEKSLSDLIEDSYVKGNIDAEISWIEYSDLECPFCAKITTNGTLSALEEKYPDSLNMVFQHFPLSFHKNAMSAAISMECVGALSGAEDYYSLKNSIFVNGNVSKEFILIEASKLGVEIEACLADNDYKEKIDSQIRRGVELFGVSGTPASIFVNNKTGEYSIISGAQQTSKFIEIIDSLLLPETSE